MTQLDQIKEIQDKLLSDENGSQTRKVKEKTLFYLLNLRNYKEAGKKLSSVIYIPKYEVDKEYLTEVLMQLGYQPEYKGEDYDGHYEATCYVIAL